MIDINLLLADNELFEIVDDTNIKQISQDVKPHLSSIIESLSKKVSYNTSIRSKSEDSSANLAKESFEFSIDLFLDKAVETYVRRKKWRDKSPFHLYLNKALVSYANSIVKDYNLTEDGTLIKLICPACSYYKVNNIINGTSGNVTCDFCSKYLDSNPPENDELILRKAFSIYSVKGFACNSCNQYIPFSYVSDGQTKCLYPNCKCDLDIGNLKFRNHPSKSFSRKLLLLNNKRVNDDKDSKSEFADYIVSDKTDNALSMMQQQEVDEDLILSIFSIIETQKRANTTELKKIPTKVCMYEAFIETLKEYPTEMINYLTKGGQGSSGDISIQATIYQNYAKLIIEKLPIHFYKNGDEINITEPTDNRLYLFNGIRQFTGYINNNLVLKKRQQDVIINGEIIKDNEEAFIGSIIEVCDSDNNDLTGNVDYYTFSNIKFNSDDNVKPGMDVYVKYYSLVPNYTVGSMIQLQRIKKKLSLSINKKYSQK